MSSTCLGFEVTGKRYTIQYLRLVYLEGYTEEQLELLAASRSYDISFRLDDYQTPDGAVVSGYGVMGTGSAFQVLGGVGNGIADWVQKHRPDYLPGYALEPKRQRLYERMVRYFAARGSGYARVPCDPFTGTKDPATFWLARI